MTVRPEREHDVAWNVGSIYRRQRRLWHQVDALLRRRHIAPHGSYSARLWDLMERQLQLFAREEQLMRQIAFPDRHLHAREHRRIREYLQTASDEAFLTAEKVLDPEVVWITTRMLSNRIRKHMSEADERFVAHCHKHAFYAERFSVALRCQRLAQPRAVFRSQANGVLAGYPAAAGPGKRRER